MPALSCGVVIANERGQVFACRATGTRRWDLPKGLADPGEAPRAAAVREAWEEAGLRLPAEALHELGAFAYLPAKRLHLFALRVAADALDPGRCHCRSFFPHPRSGRAVPEADAFAWQPAAPPFDWCGRNLARVLGGLDWSAIARLPLLPRIEVDAPA